MNVPDIVLAGLRKLMKSAIPHLIHFLTHAYDYDENLRGAGVQVLSNLSQEGSTFSSPMLMSLTQ